MDRRLAFDNTALRIALSRLDVALGHVDAFDEHAVGLRDDPEHGAALALVSSGQDDDLVILAYLSLAHGGLQHLGRE